MQYDSIANICLQITAYAMIGTRDNKHNSYV